MTAAVNGGKRATPTLALMLLVAAGLLLLFHFTGFRIVFAAGKTV